MREIMAAIAIALLGTPLNAAQPPKWRVRGEAIVTCPCKVPCPCRSNAPPSQPNCENLSYVRIVEGDYGTTNLNGLQYVWAADECTGGQHPRKPTNLYFQRTAATNQIEAIRQIMTGGHCAGPSSGEITAKRISLSASATGSRYRISANLLRIEVDLAPGDMQMEPLPALDSWGNTVTYARNITARIADPAAKLKWDYSGRQANYRTFEMLSDFIDRGLMLGLYRDDTGRFNDMQRSLIRELHLEVPLSANEFDRMIAQTQVPMPAMSGEAVPERSGSVAGSVIGTDGQPRSGARITCTDSAGRRVPNSVTNPAGRFFIARVPTGNFQLCASTWDGTVAMQSCAPISVRAGYVIRQDMKLSVINSK